ncbi:hypothetical protein N0V85_009714 [Neurospora sp. IMI 360204]|nr:hypothetical protein N0V85_009714 [Neurospora sp. IMI 360204]
MIALHAASSTAGAQLYMECAQINIVGGTGTASPSTYSIPGIYKANDPGLLVNIYSMGTNSAYTIPGPAKFTCSGGGSSPAPGTTSKVAPTSTSKAVATSTTTTLKTSVVAQPTGCTAAQWAQCGGVGFSGCTTCASPYTCKKQNDYYSQCS